MKRDIALNMRVSRDELSVMQDNAKKSGVSLTEFLVALGCSGASVEKTSTYIVWSSKGEKLSTVGIPEFRNRRGGWQRGKRK